MFKIAVIGDKDTVISFKVLGIDVFDIESPNSLGYDEFNSKIKKTVDRLALKNYGIIFITEEYAKDAPEIFEKYKKSTTPILTLIPNNRGSLNIGMNKIDENIEKAIGTNIF